LKNYAHFVSAQDAYTAPVFIYSACKRGKGKGGEKGEREREKERRKEGGVS